MLFTRPCLGDVGLNSTPNLRTYRGLYILPVTSDDMIEKVDTE